MSVFFSEFTVTFESPFWVGVFERQINNKYQVCKVVFGPEPTDSEIYEFIQKQYKDLKFSFPQKQSFNVEKTINPKRLQRVINKQIINTGIGTKAQQAIKSEQEKCKKERKTVSLKRLEEEKNRLFLLKQQKSKLKHRGH